MHSPVQIRLADTGAVASITTAGWATFAHVNEILQFVALVVAIVSGIAAGLYHYTEYKKRKGQ